MICKNCGAEAKGNFCEYCGSSLAADTQSTEQPGIHMNVNMNMPPVNKQVKTGKGCAITAGVFTVLFVLGFVMVGFISYYVNKTSEQNGVAVVSKYSYKVTSQYSYEDGDINEILEQLYSAVEKEFDEESLTEEPESPKESLADKIKISLPKTPFTVNYKTSHGDGSTFIYSKTQIISVTEERSVTRDNKAENVIVTFKLKCKKTYDYSGNEGMTTANFRFITKDGKGNILDTKQMYKMDVSVNQAFNLEYSIELPANGSYSIEIGDYAI